MDRCDKLFCNMTNDSSPQRLEQALILQLENVENRLRELVHEKEALQRLIKKIRADGLDRTDVTRKNSYNRILVENAIIKELEGSADGMTSSHIFAAIQANHYELKGSTFRSHLLRLKQRGVLAYVDATRRWKLSKPLL